MLNFLRRFTPPLPFTSLVCTCGCAALLFVACAQDGPGPAPDDVGELAQVVAELQLADALTLNVPVVLRDSVRDAYYDRVLADHGMDRAAFDERMWTMRREPEWVDTLYTRVGEILSAREEGVIDDR